MADSSLNQVVLDALRQANGASTTTTDIQTALQDLLPQSGASFSSALSDASKQIDALRSANQTLADAILNNTVAVMQNSSAQGSGGKGVASTIGSVASTIFESGFGLAPLITSIAHWFGGGQAQAPAPLLQYVAPAPLQLDLANTAQANSGVSGFSQVAYGQNGLPRSAPAAAQSSPQISIQVNALDSQSIMDHSSEIADAVRQAMLNMHPINDVVSEL